MTQATLYTFRRCPYAIRARLALSVSQIEVDHCEVDLKNKPEQLLQLSPKATVPVLHLKELVIDESLEIMHWALQQNDPEQWLKCFDQKTEETTRELISNNDREFKYLLDRYKYSSAYPESGQLEYRHQAEPYLSKIEQILCHSNYLAGDSYSFCDAALMPFIRQFAFVDINWFDSSPYPHLRAWLKKQIENQRFIATMKKR